MTVLVHVLVVAAVHVAPALALFAVLLAGRYPGERVLAAPLERARTRRPGPTTPSQRRRPPSPRCGGRLAAEALDARGPPIDGRAHSRPTDRSNWRNRCDAPPSPSPPSRRSRCRRRPTLT